MISATLKKIHPSYKEIIIKHLIILTKHLTFNNINLDTPPPLKECYRLIGICDARLQFLEEINNLFLKAFDRSMFYPGKTELKKYQDLTKKQKNILNEMIRGYLYQKANKEI